MACEGWQSMGETRLQDWIGRSEDAADHVRPWPARAFAATLNLPSAPAEGDPLPELWHWLYCRDLAPMSELGPDGHERRGRFLPPVPLERRMWAGGRLRFRGELRLGEAIGRRSEVVAVVEKEGRVGRMVLVTVRHELSSPRGLAVEEEQDLVYIARPERWAPPPPVPMPEDVAWSEQAAVDTVLLFRFSALTFNAHRIHYDLSYATEVENYPGLVVHGPLQALLLMEAARRHQPGRRPAGFVYRGVRPLFHFDRLRLMGRAPSTDGQELLAANGDGAVTMQATMVWAER